MSLRRDAQAGPYRNWANAPSWKTRIGRNFLSITELLFISTIYYVVGSCHLSAGISPRHFFFTNILQTDTLSLLEQRRQFFRRVSFCASTRNKMADDPKRISAHDCQSIGAIDYAKTGRGAYLSLEFSIVR